MSSKDEISVKANEYFEFLKKQYDEYPKVYESLEEQKEAKKISDEKVPDEKRFLPCDLPTIKEIREKCEKIVN